MCGGIKVVMEKFSDWLENSPPLREDDLRSMEAFVRNVYRENADLSLRQVVGMSKTEFQNRFSSVIGSYFNDRNAIVMIYEKKEDDCPTEQDYRKRAVAESIESRKNMVARFRKSGL